MADSCLLLRLRQWGELDAVWSEREGSVVDLADSDLRRPCVRAWNRRTRANEEKSSEKSAGRLSRGCQPAQLDRHGQTAGSDYPGWKSQECTCHGWECSLGVRSGECCKAMDIRTGSKRNE